MAHCPDLPGRTPRRCSAYSGPPGFRRSAGTFCCAFSWRKLLAEKRRSAVSCEGHQSGAQTERRGGAGPVRGLLGGKGPTGRFLSSINLYQSEPSTSPPEGVTAAHQVTPLILGASVRTLPSARPTSMPPA